MSGSHKQIQFPQQPQGIQCPAWEEMKHKSTHELENLRGREAQLVGEIQLRQEELTRVRTSIGVISGGVQAGDASLAMYWDQLQKEKAEQEKKEEKDPPKGK